MISSWANCGAYCFQSGRELAHYIQLVLDANTTQRGECVPVQRRKKVANRTCQGYCVAAG
jgi:hypothetical protein